MSAPRKRSEFVIIKNRFPQIAARLLPEAGKLVQETAFNIENRTKNRIVRQKQVRSGTMLNSVGVVRQSALTYHIVVGANYGIYVERGTRRMAGRPFFEPSMKEEGTEFNRKMRRLIRG